MSEDRRAVRSAAAVKAWNTRLGRDDQGKKVRTPHFPLYSTVRRLLVILAGVQKATLTAMIRVINDGRTRARPGASDGRTSPS